MYYDYKSSVRYNNINISATVCFFIFLKVSFDEQFIILINSI